MTSSARSQYPAGTSSVRMSQYSTAQIKRPTMIRDAYGLDEQNLAATGNFTLSESFAIRRMLESMFGLNSNDRIHVATGPGTVFEAKLVFPDADVQFGRGTNGADYKLKDQLAELIPIAHTFGKIVIGTGDHELLEEVKALIAAGGNVVLVGVRGSIYRPYYELGIQVVEIEPRATMIQSDWALSA
jgi:hypothetical protein